MLFLSCTVLAPYTLLDTLSALQLADKPSPQLRNMALDALDQSICAVLGSDHLQDSSSTRPKGSLQTVRTFSYILFVAV